MWETVKSGFVALAGRPNAGKSTLLNAVAGTKIAITSHVPQTTRHRLRAIIDRDDSQMVLIDTPGMHKPHDVLGEELNRSTLLALADVDVVCFVVDATATVGSGDRWVAAHIAQSRAAKVLVVTKVGLVDEPRLARQIDAARTLANFDDVVAVSALEGFNVEGFVECVLQFLPDGPRYFPRDMPTDQPIEVMMAEFVREKVLLFAREEVPHAVGVVIDDVEWPESDDGLTRISATVFVERESQKGIIVGKRGEMIKRVGTDARHDLERLLGTRVYLDLVVKVKKNWRRDASQIRRFGYGEGL